MNKELWRKIGKIALNVVLYLFLAVCLFAVLITVFGKKDDDGAAELFGYQLRVVTSPSMAKCDQTDVSDFDIGSIPVYSMILVECVPEDPEEAHEWYDDLEEGDVLTFRYVYADRQLTITHRITSIKEENGGFTIELEGDNKNDESGQLVQTIYTGEEASYNYVIGKVISKNFPLGFVISMLKKQVGLVLIVMVPCVIIIVLEIMKIVGVFTAEKKKKAEEEQARKDAEMEELRRRLAELEVKPAEEKTPPENEE